MELRRLLSKGIGATTAVDVITGHSSPVWPRQDIRLRKDAIETKESQLFAVRIKQ